MNKKLIGLSFSLFILQSCFAMEQAQQHEAQSQSAGTGLLGAIGQLFGGGANLKQNGLFVLNEGNGPITDQVQRWLSNHPVDEIDDRGNTLLHVAAQMKNRAVVDLLLERGSSVDIQNQEEDTPLHIAVRVQSRAIVDLLLDREATVNIQNQVGDIPLHIALRNHHFAIVEILLDHGADVRCINNMGNTIFHAVAQSQNDNLIEPLLRWERVKNALRIHRGQEKFIDFRNQHGPEIVIQQAAAAVPQEGADTVLHIAARYGLSNTISMLLENEARTDIVNRAGLTAYEVAVQSGDQAAAGLLQPPSLWARTLNAGKACASYGTPAYNVARILPVVGPRIRGVESKVGPALQEALSAAWNAARRTQMPAPAPQATDAVATLARMLQTQHASATAAGTLTQVAKTNVAIGTVSGCIIA